MSWKDLTVADVFRLVTAIEQAGGTAAAVRAIIERVPPGPMEHGRVTLETVLNLLDQLNGRTVLSDEDLRRLNRSGVPAVVQPTFVELLAACNLIWYNPRFIEANFPLVDDGTVAPIVPYSFGREVEWVDLLELLAAANYTPVGIRRALQWLADNSELQWPYPIAIIGAIQGTISSAGTAFFPSIERNSRQILLETLYPHTGFCSDARFLVCQKS